MHKDDCIWTEPNRCNCGWLQDIAKNPCEAVREIERLRAELAEWKDAVRKIGPYYVPSTELNDDEVNAMYAMIDAARKGEGG